MKPKTYPFMPRLTETERSQLAIINRHQGHSIVLSLLIDLYYHDNKLNKVIHGAPRVKRTTTSTHLNLSKETLAQLKELAKIRVTTMTGVVRCILDHRRKLPGDNVLGKNPNNEQLVINYLGKS